MTNDIVSLLSLKLQEIGVGGDISLLLSQIIIALALLLGVYFLFKYFGKILTFFIGSLAVLVTGGIVYGIFKIVTM